MGLAPPSVHHEVHEFNQWIAVELSRQQLVQFSKRLLKLGMIVLRLDIVDGLASRGAVSRRPRANLDQGDFFLQTIGDRNLLRLEIRAGKLDPESDPQVAGLGGVQRQLPDWIQVQFPGSLLHVAPVAPYV